MSKILMIDLDTNAEYRLGHFERLEEYGVELHLILNKPDYDPKYAARVSILRNNFIDDLIQLAESLHEIHKFDGILSIDELSVIATAHVSRALGLPGQLPEVAVNSRNKSMMRDCMSKAEVSIPRYFLCKTFDDARIAAENFGFPVVLKPTLGASSEHVYLIKEPSKLAHYFELIEQGLRKHSLANLEIGGVDIGPNSILLEEYLDGSEHAVEAFIWDDEIIIGSIADRLSIDSELFDDDLYNTPTALNRAQQDEIKNLIKKAAQAIGLKRAAVHAEVRFHKGIACIVEIASRIGGGSLFEMARIAYGYCSLKAALCVTLNINDEISAPIPTGIYAVGLTILCQQGKISNIRVGPEIYEDERVFNFRLLRKQGDIVHRPPNGNDILGYLGTKGDNLDATIEAAETLAKQIAVQFEKSLSDL